MPKTATDFAAPPSPFPSSRKRYITGRRGDVRVPVREISLSPTHHSKWVEQNPPLTVYDCSGPYTDPDAHIDLAGELTVLRHSWIEEREHTEPLPRLTSAYG